MPATLLHLALVDRFGREPRGLPRELSRAIQEEAESARFGAALPDLPFFEGVRGALEQALRRTVEVPPFARLFHSAAPVAFGLKLAELVATGSFVRRPAGRALVAGYFSHLAIDRALHPPTDLLAARVRRRDESARAAHERVEWVQACLFLRETEGHDLLGTAELSRRLRLLDKEGRGVSRGHYELIRLASEEALGVAPGKRLVDGWCGGFRLYARLLSTAPVGRLLLPRVTPEEYRTLFHGPAVDWPGEVERALKQARQLLTRAHAYMASGDFSARSAGRFAATFPEGTSGALAG